MSVVARAAVGVLGGMGPAATTDFITKLRAATPATCDQDHVPLIVHCVPQIPDRSSAILTGSDEPFAPLLAGVRLLERSGVAAIAIPCNSAHFWHRRLAAETGVPILHIAQAAREAVMMRGQPIGRMALMCTRGMLATGIYQDCFQGAPLELVLPDAAAQAAIDRAIAAVKAGTMPTARLVAETAAELLLVEQRCDVLLMACTELPIAFRASRHAGLCIDATLALAQACVRYSLGLNTKGSPQ